MSVDENEIKRLRKAREHWEKDFGSALKREADYTTISFSFSDTDTCSDAGADVRAGWADIFNQNHEADN
ncbi:MAG: hypothetical protein ACREOP_00770 [Thermodesulfobacteriota bacterium]